MQLLKLFQNFMSNIRIIIEYTWIQFDIYAKFLFLSRDPAGPKSQKIQLDVFRPVLVAL